MDPSERRRSAYRFVALRINTLGCLLLLTPVILWSGVSGMSALLVAVFWSGTIGARSANAWASARARGLPGRGAATSAGWWRAAAVLVLAVASAVLTATTLRRLTVLGDWMAAPDISRPVVGALTIVLGGAVMGTASVVVLSPSRALTGAASGRDEPIGRRRGREGQARGRRAAAAVAAAVLTVVNVVVLTSVTAVGEWMADDAVKRIIALAVLTLAFAAPTAAVWYADRTADTEPKP